MSFHAGQCWTSQAEPELGLGFVQEVTARTVSVFFEASNITRTYQVQSAPLQRVQFNVGDQISTTEQEKIYVEKIETSDGLLIYHGEGRSIPETLLCSQISFNTPEDRILGGHVEPLATYQLRQEALQLQQKIMSSPARGFIGPRVDLLQHQLYVASEIAKRAYPRVLLSDEVGLGKTIEAGLILHHMLLTGKAKRILIAVPEALTNQWFVEMYRRYNLAFGTITTLEDFPDQAHVFEERQLHITSIEFLCKHKAAAQAACQSTWDLLIVDEAHHLTYKDGQASPEFSLIKRISQKSLGLLLLTATPEQLGLEGHFSRLQLLDPDRFYSYEAFQTEAQKYQALAQQAQQLLAETKTTSPQKTKALQELIDQHGTGRVLFRNTRSSIAASNITFPKRVACPHPLDVKNTQDPRATKYAWLLQMLAIHPNKKFLLTCHHKQQVLDIEVFLRNQGFLQYTTFHDNMTLLTRDRNAAYFSETSGAQIMICSEIGSEGRNFQFAHDLILFDLPEDPDVLEQRMGRLDRIGQTQDISIHIPYIKNSSEEVFFRFYHEGFQAFEHCPTGAQKLFQKMRAQLTAVAHMFDAQETTSKEAAKKLAAVIQTTQQEYQLIVHALQQGRDQLIELNSFHPQSAQNIMEQIQLADNDSDLQAFLLRVCNVMNVNQEQLDETTYFMEPGDAMYIQHFPELPEQGLRITFDRQTALVRQDTAFMSWDHPMLMGIMDMILGQEYGNVTLSSWNKQPTGPHPALEAQFVLTFIAPLEYNIAEFFPPTLFRVALSATGEDVSTQWPCAKLQAATKAADQIFAQQIKHLPRQHMLDFISQAKACIQTRADTTKAAYEKNMRQNLESEINRLQTLQKKNGLVRDAEIQYFKTKIQLLTKASNQAQLRLDSFQLIQSP